jgi:hypothetical protein
LNLDNAQDEPLSALLEVLPMRDALIESEDELSVPSEETCPGHIAPVNDEALISDTNASIALLPEESDAVIPSLATTSLRDQEEHFIGGEILFGRSSSITYFGWDNLRWLSYAGERKASYCQSGYRLVENVTKQLFWSSTVNRYEPAKIAIYSNPDLILVLRSPRDEDDLMDCLGVDILDDLDDAMKTFWVVTYVIDPASCKLRLSFLTTPTSTCPTGADERRQSCLEIITPLESIFFSAVRERSDVVRCERSFADSGAFLETSAVEMALTKALCTGRCADLGKLGEDLSWKHAKILGTLHSYVVAADCKALDRAIKCALAKLVAESEAKVTSLPSRVVDAHDENGLTALFYACTRRMEQAVMSLVNAGADPLFREGALGLSLVHICARNLDDKSLSILLSVQSNKKPDPNVLDLLGRTPMYLACIKGRSVSGMSDAQSLDRCIKALEEWGGQMTITDPLLLLPSPVSLLAAEWRADELCVVLEHVSFRFPLHDVSSLEGEAIDMSLASLHQYPLHSALASFIANIHLGMKTNTHMPDRSLTKTLRCLLDHGFEPNERLHAFTSDANLGLHEYVGFSPIQILAVVATRVEDSQDMIHPSMYQRARSLIENAAEFLVRNGARTTFESPPCSRQLQHDVDFKSFSASENDSKVSDSTQASLEWGSKRALSLLGDEKRLKLAQKEWADLKSVTATNHVNVLQDDAVPFPDTCAPGGSNEKSCAICWGVFGKMMNRKHKCRVSRRFVCDDCSSKRLLAFVLGNLIENRVSDGQFLLASSDAAILYKDVFPASNTRDDTTALTEEVSAVARFNRLEVSERSNRDMLFGGLIGQVFGESVEGPLDVATGLASTLGETRDALNDRGQKLGTMRDKSADLVDSSANFAKMARELRKKSEGGMFW